MAKRLLIILGALLVVILGFFLLLRKPAVAPTVGNATNTASSDEVLRLANAAVQWDQYRLDPTVELGTGDCGDQTWTAAIDELNSDQRKSYKLNGVLTLVTTPNPKQWTNDQFQAYAQSDQAICGRPASTRCMLMKISSFGSVHATCRLS